MLAAPCAAPLQPLPRCCVVGDTGRACARLTHLRHGLTVLPTPQTVERAEQWSLVLPPRSICLLNYVPHLKNCLLPFASPTQGWTLFSLPLHKLSVPSWGFQDEDRPPEDMGQSQLRSGCLGRTGACFHCLLGQQVLGCLPAGAAWDRCKGCFPGLVMEASASIPFCMSLCYSKFASLALVCLTQAQGLLPQLCPSFLSF